MGVRFKVWRGQPAWLWFVPKGNGGAIGAAMNEAEAMREARRSIEAISSHRAPTSVDACYGGWMSALERLADYLKAFGYKPLAPAPTGQ